MTNTEVVTKIAEIMANHDEYEIKRTLPFLETAIDKLVPGDCPRDKQSAMIILALSTLIGNRVVWRDELYEAIKGLLDEEDLSKIDGLCELAANVDESDSEDENG